MVSRARFPLRGEIWPVDLDPVVGSEQAGRRPVLIVSSNTFHQIQDRLIVIIPITRTRRGFRLHVEFAAEEAGLEHPGSVMCDQVRVVSTGRLLSHVPIGRMNAEVMRKVDDLVRVLLDL